MRFAAAFVFLLAFCIVPQAAHAHSYRSDDIFIGHPWALPAPPGQKETPVFLSLLNRGKQPDSLLGVETPVAGDVDMIVEAAGEIVTLMPAIGLPVNKGVALKPRAKYFLLKGLRAPLPIGAKFPLTLHFKSAPSVVVTVIVEEPGRQH